MVEMTMSGQPVVCSGCRAAVERVTEAMQHPVPAFVACALTGEEGMAYVVCEPLPDGTQPCLERAVLMHAIAAAGIIANGVRRWRAPRLVVGCVPVHVAEALSGPAWPTYGPADGHQRATCVDCGCEAWVSAVAREFEQRYPGRCVRVCIPCAVVEFATHGHGWAYDDPDQLPWLRLLGW